MNGGRKLKKYTKHSKQDVTFLRFKITYFIFFILNILFQEVDSFRFFNAEDCWPEPCESLLASETVRNKPDL